MKQVIVSIPNNKVGFFLKLMNSLQFVKIIGPKPKLEDQLSPGQKKLWKNIKRGFVELELAEEGKIEFRPIEDLLNEL